MLSPGAKGWINKFFDLVENKTIKGYRNKHAIRSDEHFLLLLFGRSGLIFGQPTRYIFANKIDDSKWTPSEKLKFLLFEAHLLVYQQNHKIQHVDKDAFIQSLLLFYEKHAAKNPLNVVNLMLKESDSEKVERILAKRIDIKLNLLSNKWWVSSLHNVFVYLNVVLYHRFLHENDDDALDLYSEYAFNALTSMAMAAYADGILDEKEKSIFDVFLASANLRDDFKTKAIKQIKKGATFEDFTSAAAENWFLKRFVLDLSILTIFSGHEPSEKEIGFLTSLANHFDIPEAEFDEHMVIIENFVLDNHTKIPYLASTTSYERVYSSLSSRWGKVIMRNKDKLAAELKESKQLVGLIKKSATEELSKEEKEMVKTQFMDIVKSVPALAIFMLPGGAVLLPIVLKLLPDLVPSAFKENEVD